MSVAVSREESSMGVVVRAATDLGRKRTQNEDSHGVWVPDDPESLRRRGVLLVVADGMGGSRAGEVASRLAVETVLRAYREGSGENPLEDLYRAIEQANRVVHRESATHPELAGMGTTCTAIVVREPDAFVVHVGDSRAYLIQDGRIRQLTRDHSLVAQLVRDGQLTPEQAKVDPRRNVVTRSVGVGAHVEIDADHEPGLLQPGDTLLLCSDGLHGLVADEELQAAASAGDMEQGCRDAIALANERGGPDNITLILARMVEGAGSAGAVGGGSAEHAHAPAAAGDGSHQAATDATVAAGDDDEEAPPVTAIGGAPRGEGRRPSSTAMTLWLILALVVLLAAVAAIAVVFGRLGSESKRLGSNRPEVRLAWR